MAICNLFQKLTKDTGTFLQFSQYSEDLTRMLSGSNLYKVVPSKFVAANINYKTDNSDADWNTEFPKTLQNYFENGCAVLKEQIEWNPEYSRNLFWNYMFGQGYLSTQQSSDGYQYVPQIKYVSTIDLMSYEQWEGMGYNEIYCYISNDALPQNYGVSKLQGASVYECNDTYIQGFDESDSIALDGTLVPPTNYVYGRQWVMSFESDLQNQGVQTFPNTTDTNYFEINTIIVLYDIMVQDGDTMQTIYWDIPMGIYLPGTIANVKNDADLNETETQEEGTVHNFVTKYISNADIYGAGTSYGLRICSRFTPTPNNDTIQTVDIHVESDQNAALCRVLAGMSDLQTQMSEIVLDVYKENQASKELLAIFKNSRTNVPYIKEVNGIKTWFVNGRSLDATIDEISGTGVSECIPATKSEIQHTIDEYEITLTPSLSIEVSISQRLFEKTVPQTPTSTELFWQAYYRGAKSSVDSIDINGTMLAGDATRYSISDLAEDTTYTVKAIKGSLQASASVLVQFVFPTFVGYTTASPDEITEDIIKTGQKYLKSSWVSTYQLEPASQRTYIAYPQSFGEVGKIIDAKTQIDITPEFEKKGIQVNGEAYWCYIHKDLQSVSNLVIQLGYRI